MNRWPRTRVTIQTLDFRAAVVATRTVWGEVETREAMEESDLSDTGQRDFISRSPVLARAHTRGDRAHVGERVIDAQGRVWTVTGVVGGDSPWSSGETLILEADVSGGARQ